MSSKYLRPVYGWAMNFVESNQYSPYHTEENRQGLYQNRNAPDCATNYQRDGLYSQSPPFYRLSPYPDHKNPIYYNYILPNIQYKNDFSYPKPSQYWYYPYYKNNCFWENNPENIYKA